MRYLYGDSTPFPLSYDFLGTLEIFMASATRAVKLHDEAVSLEAKAAEQSQARIAGIGALEKFHQVVMKAIADTANRVSHPSALDYAREVGDLAQRFVGEQQRQVSHANERDAQSTAREVGQRRIEAHAAIEDLFLRAELSLERATTRAVLQGAQYQTSATFVTAGNMTCGYQLRPSAPWDAARKVGDLAKGTSLKVAVKKSFFKGVVTAEPLAIDDYVISQVELAPGRATVCLRKKLTEPDVLVLTLVDAGPSKLATVEHPGNVDAEALSPELDAQDTERLARLVGAIGDSLRGLHGQKERLVELRLDDKDAMGGALVIELVERFVTLFAPTVAEIARRSPNDAELSLKREHDGGRREEVYLRKADLVDKLQPLWAHGRQVFAPLGLDGWVPNMTMAPPPVVVTSPASIPPPPISAPLPPGPPSGKLPEG